MIFSISKVRPVGHDHVYKYAHATNKNDIKRISVVYDKDTINDREWTFPLLSLKKDCYELFSNHNQTQLIKFNSPLPSLQTGDRMLNWNNGLIEFDSFLPELKSGVQMFDTCTLTTFNVPLPKLENGNYMFYRCSSLVNFESDLPSLKNGSFMFETSKLNKASVIRIINSLPTYTSGSHLISFGIHMDYKYDKELNYHLKRLDSAYEETVHLDNVPEEYKGWGVSVYWRGVVTSNEVLSPKLLNDLELNEVELPPDYKRCYYLESNGNNYIDTSYIPNDESGLFIIAKQISTANTHVMGSGFDQDSNGFGAPRVVSGHNSGTMWKGWHVFGWLDRKNAYIGTTNFLNDRKTTLDIIDVQYSIELPNLDFTPSYPIFMFSTSANGKPLHLRNGFSSWVGRIYRAKISQGTEIIRDFIPCLNPDGKPCMYDIINDVEYHNQGTGADFEYELYS